MLLEPSLIETVEVLHEACVMHKNDSHQASSITLASETPALATLPETLNVRIKTGARYLLCAWILFVPVVGKSAPSTQQEYETVLRSKADPGRGKQLFVPCAACHGPDGAGVEDGSVPAIAGQHFRVLAGQLVDFRHDKRWDRFMEHYADEHNLGDAQDLANVANYISNLAPVRTQSMGDGEFVSKGAQVYARACASCHGAAGQGNSLKGYPRLAAQHYAYLLRQMHDAVEGRRPNFSRAHVRLLERFDRSEFVGTADYLSRLGH
jgi:cytochrome c553